MRKRSVAIALALVVTTAAGCAPSQMGRATERDTALAQARVIRIAVLNAVGGFGLMRGGSSPVGGWGAAEEIHSNGFITSELKTRQAVGLLAERVPSIDDGSISVLPDGRMRVAYALRKGVTWQDGTPFTAQDLAFTTRFLQDPNISLSAGGQEVPRRIGSVETPDAHTFTAYFRAPYYKAGALGITDFWPQPQHILGPVYDAFLNGGGLEDILNHPYWTSEYVHLGPFRLTAWDPSREIVFQAHDGYFRGRPKLDTIRVEVFLDLNTLYANLLAGTIDVIHENTIDPEQGAELERRWRETGEGVAFLKPSNMRVLIPQHRPAYQIEQSNLDPAVRVGLYRALDREELAEGLQAGHRETAAWGMLLPGDPMHQAMRDIFRPYAYDPERAKATLQDRGWIAGPDGMLRHTSDGRRFRNAMSGPPDYVREISAYASYWRRIGIEVDELVVPPAQVRSNEYRATYPGWEATAGAKDFLRLTGPAAGPETRWVGNRGGYDDPRMNVLLGRFDTAISEREQLDIVKAIAEIVASELPLLPLFYTVEYIAVRKGAHAFQEDHEGGFTSGNYGTYARNVHVWTVD